MRWSAWFRGTTPGYEGLLQGQEEIMSGVTDVMKGFKEVTDAEYGARFFRADLHFHTPASSDARGKDKYNFNPYKTKAPSDKQKALILEEAGNLAEQIVARFQEENLGLVAVTDHNGIGTLWNDSQSRVKAMDLSAPTWYELIDDAAQKVNKKAGQTVLTILPGVEISTTGIHILAVFPPQEPRRKIHFIICDLLQDVGFAIDDWGKNPKVGKASVFDTIELIHAKGGLCIIAHADGSDKALLKLYKVNSGAMKNVYSNNHLHAIEVVDTASFEKTYKGMKEPLSQWITKLRNREDLSSFAYFQGSDAHRLKDIAKRSSYVKMTEPSFQGLKIAVNVPSSRVRFYDHVQEMYNRADNCGLYLYGLEIINSLFGKSAAIRFNRHLNCVVGKRGSGKSSLFQLIRKCVPGEPVKIKGKVKLFMERIVDSQSEFYMMGKESANPSLFSIDKAKGEAEEMEPGRVQDLDISPRFYDPETANRLIDSSANFNEFLIRWFGPANEENIKTFNDTFAIPIFLEAKNHQLLVAEADGNNYKLFLNTAWQKGKIETVAFDDLDYSLRRVILTCIILISGSTGPLIIDAPEEYFNNMDIVDYLVPVIRKFKDVRQIILFTNQPVLAVNTDPENYILLENEPGKAPRIESGFSIDKKESKDKLVNIMEGGISSFKKRLIRYDITG